MTTARRAQSVRRRRKWVEIRAVQQAAPLGGQSNSTLLPAGIEHVGSTLSLLLIQLSLHPDGDETAGDSCILEYGIAIVNEDAGAASAFPDPSGIDQVPWLMRDHAYVIKSAATTNADTTYRSYQLKGQRVIRDASSRLSFIIDNANLIAAMDVTYHITGRALLLLP